MVSAYGVLALALLACFLPIPHTEVQVPDVIGTYRHSDGTPMPPSEITIAVDEDDQTCTQPRATTVTDSSGRFQFQGATIRRHWTFFTPGFDLAPFEYHLCGGSTGRTLSPLSGGLSTRVDSIDCFEWVWEGRSRTTCYSRDEMRRWSGGQWTEGDAKGHFRLVFPFPARRPTIPGGLGGVPPHVFVQWVEQGDGDDHAVIRATAELPMDSTILMVHRDAVLSEHDGRWRVTLRATRRRTATLWSGNAQRVELTYELGLPGQVRAVGPPA